MKMILLRLSLLVFAVSFAACGNIKFESTEKPEDKVVELQTLSESPKSKIQDYMVDAEVAVIDNEGVFKVECQIAEIGGKLIFAPTVYRGRAQGKAWMPFEQATIKNGDEPIVPKGYKVRIRQGRSSDYIWFPPSQIFPAPWANAKNLKAGDVVFENRFGNFEPKKGIITELPASKGGSFRVKFEGYERDENVEPSKIFSSIAKAQLDKLNIGDIVYFDQMYWAIVVAKQDGKVVIREAGFPAKDRVVDISKLEIIR